MHFKFDTISFSNPLQSDCLSRHIRYVDIIILYVLQVCTFRAGCGCGEWNAYSCSKSRSCLFDCRLVALMYLISLCVCSMCVFTGILWELQLGERSSSWAAAGNCGPLPQTRPTGLEWGGTDRSAHRSLWLFLLWVERNTHTHSHTLWTYSYCNRYY